jgi:hypothetical protein
MFYDTVFVWGSAFGACGCTALSALPEGGCLGSDASLILQLAPNVGLRGCFIYCSWDFD